MKGGGDELWAEPVHKVSCPVCDAVIILPEGIKAGDKISHCGREFTMTFEFGTYALEEI